MRAATARARAAVAADRHPALVEKAAAAS
jgi:hypothetical protein